MQIDVEFHVLKKIFSMDFMCDVLRKRQSNRKKKDFEQKMVYPGLGKTQKITKKHLITYYLIVRKKVTIDPVSI